MERLTGLGNLGLYIPKKLIDDNRSYCEEYCFERCDLCPVCDCFQKLAEYENAEEQLRMFTFPVPIGGKLYEISSFDTHNVKILEWTVKGLKITDTGCIYIDIGNGISINASQIGTRYFLTYEGAKEKTEETEEEE